MGTDNISNTPFAARRGEQMKLMSSLRGIGAHADLDLPQIVCIGNQSAGKSSLIEAISETPVPRDSGTCTRCPMECRLSGAEGWSAKLSIRIEFDERGKQLSQPHTQNLVTITDRKEIEIWLRRAQAAILCWRGSRESIRDILEKDEDELRAVLLNNDAAKFSKNPVCLDISGPGLTDLVFIDLPGIIQAAEDDNTVVFVQNMVLEQIAEPSSIILLTLPMIDDMDNQRAVSLRKKVDPDGLRTIGVLTKPDLMSEGAMRSREAWIDVIEGRRHPLRHGYFCTRQPEDAERAANITNGEAREKEADFFARTEPWSSSPYRDRFGTGRLVAKLSDLLSQKITESLPGLQKQISDGLTQTTAELATLPQQLSDDPSTELLVLVAGFVEALWGTVKGTTGAEELVQDTFKSYKVFKTAIRHTAPDFRPFETVHQAKKAGVETEGEWDLGSVVGDEALVPGSLGDDKTRPVYLEDLRRHIENAVTRELPNNVPFSAKVALIHHFTDRWVTPVQTCFDAVRVRTMKTVRTLVSAHFGRFAKLENVVWSFVSDDIDRCGALAQNMLETVLAFEVSPYTQNDHYFMTCKDKFYDHYKAVRAGKVHVTSVPSMAKGGKTPVLQSERAVTNGEVGEGKSKSPAFEIKKTESSVGQSTPTNEAASDAAHLNGAKKPAAPVAPPFSNTPNPFSGFAPPASSTFGGFGGFGATTAFGGFSEIAGAPASTSRLPSFLTNSGAPFGASRGSTSASPTFGDTVSSSAPTLVPTPAVSGGDHKKYTLEDLQNALAALAKIGFYAQEEDLSKLLPNDEYEEEMRVAAEVRAFFQVTYKTIIDIVPKTIDNIFLRGLAKDMQKSLISRLELGDKDRAASLVAEDDFIVQRRQKLIVRKKRLESAREELLRFGMF